jgi:hypothetical protein
MEDLEESKEILSHSSKYINYYIHYHFLNL